MSANGVPDVLTYTRLARVVNELKQQADTSRTETVTGQYADITSAVKGDIGGVHLIQKAIDDAKIFQQNLSLAANRASGTQAVLGNLTNESTRIGTSGLAALAGDNSVGIEAVSIDAKSTLYTIFASLNTTAGGRALFAGDATDTPPLGSVDDLLADVKAIIDGATDADDAATQLDFYFNDPAGGFETTIYKGGAGDAPAVELANGIRINASAKANAQPIKDMIRSFAVLANYESLPSGSAVERDKIANSAASLALTAETNITEMRAVLGVAEGRIADRQTQYEAEEIALTSLFNSKVARDPYEAAAQLQLYETQLEASYLLTSRLSTLSLANYLR